jgi:crotonobetainyl-CoA:carnitine CoA-transferase CaiB-like acyl-CoA transferase
MALHEREKSGRGQFCDMTLHDCGMALLHPHAANFFLSGKRPKATGNPHPNLAPYSKFQTRTCEIFVAAGNDPAFRKFCEFLDMPEMAIDPRFASNGARVTNRDALTEVLNARFANEDGHELTRRMLAAGLPAGPVLNVDEAMAADHTAHRKMVTELGAYRGLGTPIKLSRTPGGTRRPPPRFNEHGEAVLRARGFSDAEIAELARDGVLVTQRRR